MSVTGLPERQMIETAVSVLEEFEKVGVVTVRPQDEWEKAGRGFLLAGEVPDAELPILVNVPPEEASADTAKSVYVRTLGKDKTLVICPVWMKTVMVECMRAVLRRVLKGDPRLE